MDGALLACKCLISSRILIKAMRFIKAAFVVLECCVSNAKRACSNEDALF